MITPTQSRLITLAIVLLIALPISVPAPMSEQEMGIVEGQTPQQEARAIEDFHRENDINRAEVLAEAEEAGRARRVARTATTPIPPEATMEIAARSRQARAERAAQSTPASTEAGGNSTLHIMVIGLLIVVVGWGIWLFKRFGSPQKT